MIEDALPRNLRMNDLLGVFADGPTMRARTDAMRQIMAARKIAAAAREPQFQEGIVAVGGILAKGAGPDRLLAADLLMRIAKTVPGARENVFKLLAGVVDPFPPLAEMPDTAQMGSEFKSNEARLNVALALDVIDSVWSAPYRLTSLINEDRSDKVQSELARQILVRSPSLEAAFHSIAEAAQCWRPATDRPSETAANRARDLLNALTEAVRASRVGASPAVGSAMGELGRVFFSRTKLPQANKPLEECAAALVRLLDEVLAPRFDLLVEAASYDSLSVIIDWWGSTPAPPSLTETLSPIREKLRAAILLLARMQQRSVALLEKLWIAAGSREAGLEILKGLDEEHPELDSGTRAWLRSGGRAVDTTQDLMLRRLEASIPIDFDQELARLLAETSVLSDTLKEQADSILLTLGMADVSHEQMARSLMGRFQSLIHDIHALARQRGFELRGRPGDLESYSPSGHEPVDGVTPKEPKIRLITPMVVRVSDAGPTDIILRAKVRPAS